MALRRQIALLAALVAGVIALAGCGGDDSSAEIDPSVSADINAKLDRIQERANAGNCTGDDSAESSLDGLEQAVPVVLEGEDEQFVSDLNEMLDKLGEQIAEQCEEVDEPDTTSTSTATTTEETTTEPTTTTEETTTDETKSTPSTTTTEEPPTDPTSPPNPPGGGGTPGGNGPPGGTPPGQSGGFTPGRTAAEAATRDEKPQKHKHGKPKDENK